MAAEAGDEVVEDVGVAGPAVADELDLDEDVLGDEDAARAGPASRRRRDGLGVLLVGGGLGLLVGVEVVHADHVVFEPGAAAGQLGLVVEVLAAGVHVAEDRLAQVAAFFGHDVEHAAAVALPAREVDLERDAGRVLRPRRAAQDLFLLGGEILGDADLADDAGADAVDALDDVLLDLRGDGFQAHLLARGAGGRGRGSSPCP